MGSENDAIDNRIQVDSQKDVWSIIKYITQSGYQDDAFYICNLSDIISQHKRWKTIMPRIQPHYAVKCNDTKLVLEVLDVLGASFDCASEEEIRKVLELGVSPNRIIFANPSKKPSHMRYAAEMGVTLMTFDNECELYKVKKYCPDVRLVIRILYDDPSASSIFGDKFGCDHNSEAEHLLRVARSLGVNVIGVSFHIGCCSKDESYYMKAIAAARYVFDVAATLDYKFNFLDIGGGFPGGRSKDFLHRIGTTINAALEMYFADPNILIISEPGRFYVEFAFTLAASVHSVKEKSEINPKSKEVINCMMYFVDVSVFGVFYPNLQDEILQRPLNTDQNTKKYPSIIWGGTCSPLDKICHNVLLPKLEIGDWIIFEDTGAYTLTIASDFNGIPRPKVHFIIDESDWQFLRQHERFPMDRFVMGDKVEHYFTGLSSLKVEQNF